MTDTVSFYDRQAEQLAAQYDGLTFEQVHGSWLALFTRLPAGRALDIGAGSGRDAVALSQRGWRVTAIDTAGLRQLGQAKDPAIHWLESRLPALPELNAADPCDLILLSAVWMHLPVADRPAALRRLSELLTPEGMIVISLRHGDSDPQRPMYPVSVTELEQLAAPLGLSVELLVGAEQDQLKREAVWRQTVSLSRH